METFWNPPPPPTSKKNKKKQTDTAGSSTQGLLKNCRKTNEWCQDYTSTRGHPLKIYKRRFRLNLRGNYFNRIINTWNELPTNVVMAPTLNSFKTRLNKCWYGHPHKFEPWCYIPGERSRSKIPQMHQQRF